MAINTTLFYPYNVTDTCAVWNVLFSQRLYAVARDANCHFVCTAYVIYECLVKPRKLISRAEEILKKRLVRERAKGHFREFHLTLDELEELVILQRRQRLGKGELSSLAFARRHRQALLTDDQKARRFASELFEDGMVQTTPHLLGWLFYTARLLDSDFDDIIREHEEVNRPLSRYFQEMYYKGMECRARDRISSK